MTMSDPSKKLLDLQERQTSGELIPCPRCGRMGMKNPLERNALSRYAVLYICDERGMTEAMLAMMHNPLPLEQWAVFKETGPQLDFKALHMQEVAARVIGSQTEELSRLHEAWIHQREGEHFDTYRIHALKTCYGLIDLCENPFCAVYHAQDGRVMVRLRWNDGKSEIAVDTLPEKKQG